MCRCGVPRWIGAGTGWAGSSVRGDRGTVTHSRGCESCTPERQSVGRSRHSGGGAVVERGRWWGWGVLFQGRGCVWGNGIVAVAGGQPVVPI